MMDHLHKLYPGIVADNTCLPNMKGTSLDKVYQSAHLNGCTFHSFTSFSANEVICIYVCVLHIETGILLHGFDIC